MNTRSTTSTLQRALRALTLGGFALALPAALSAQDGDARWLPWVGCWQASSPAVDGSDAGMVCFRPDGEGVELLTVHDGEIVSSESLLADGEPRERAAEGCSGVEAVRFSDDGRRIFMTSDQQCEGGTARSASGIIAMLSPNAWLDVKSIDVEGERLALVEVYRLVDDRQLEGTGLAGLTAGREMAIGSARVAAASSITPAQVAEASRRVHEQTVQAWVAEGADPFSLSAAVVERLAAEGVAPATIDVMVAVSYPDRFMIDREARADHAPAARSLNRTREAQEAYGLYRGPRSPFHWDPFFMSAFRFRYGYDMGYGYGGYGYGGYGYGPYGGWVGYQPTVVVVEPESGPRGRVINGQGYTRSRAGGTSRGASGATGATYPTARSGAVGSTSRGGSSSTGTTTRRAKPRGGGGGGSTMP